MGQHTAFRKVPLQELGFKLAAVYHRCSLVSVSENAAILAQSSKGQKDIYVFNVSMFSCLWFQTLLPKFPQFWHSYFCRQLMKPQEQRGCIKAN